VVCRVARYAPFQAKNPDDREELFRVIKRGKLVFHDRYWKSISAEAKDMITQMLNVDPDARPHANALLRHAWIGASRPSLMKTNLEESQVRGLGAGEYTLSSLYFPVPQLTGPPCALSFDPPRASGTAAGVQREAQVKGRGERCEGDAEDEHRA